MRLTTLATVALAALLASVNLHASELFVAFLDGDQDGVASPATGFGTVLLNDAQDQITVDFSWSGLIGGPATAAHIHCCAGPAGTGPVLFPFSGVSATTSGSIPEQTFAITPGEVTSLMGGLMYMNIHDATFPAGEIRGQLEAAPEPATLGSIGIGLVGLGLLIRRRRRQ